MNKEYKINPNYMLNDKLKFSSHPIYDIIAKRKKT